MTLRGTSSSGRPPADAPALRLSREGARRIDTLARERFGIPSLLLMEHAAIQTRDACLAQLAVVQLAVIQLAAIHRGGPSGGAAPPGRVLVVCGPGNNGGDGFAAARLLHLCGVGVRVLASNEDPSETTAPSSRGVRQPTDHSPSLGDAALNRRITRGLGVPIESLTGRSATDALAAVIASWPAPPDLVVDALLGTGLDRPIGEPMTSLIAAIDSLRRGGSRVLAVDIPSGLDADTGAPLGAAVRADATVTFVAPKIGFDQPGACEYTGEVIVADIGVPPELLALVGRPRQR